MSIIGKAGKTFGLSLVFMVVADVALAGGMGMIGVHGFVVEGGVSLGDAWGVPQVDWVNLWENWELDFLDPETDPCLSAGGHYHGSVCDFTSHDLSQNLVPDEPLTFEP